MHFVPTENQIKCVSLEISGTAHGFYDGQEILSCSHLTTPLIYIQVLFILSARLHPKICFCVSYLISSQYSQKPGSFPGSHSFLFSDQMNNCAMLSLMSKVKRCVSL